MRAQNSSLVVVGLGELLWDCFPDRRLPGGAPANVAYHAACLELSGVVCSRLGEDPLGGEMRSHLTGKGLATDAVQADRDHSTGRVEITLDSSGEPSYEFTENAAWDFLENDAGVEALMRGADAVCFGTLAQRCAISAETIHHCLAAAKRALIVYDVNLRPPHFQRAAIERSLAACHVVKLNTAELKRLGEMFSLPGNGETDAAASLRSAFDLDAVCVTRGERGCLIVDREESIEERGLAVRDAHAVGAGDAFAAALIGGRLSGRGWRETARFANRYAALVASRPGAMPEMDAGFARDLSQIR